MFLTGAIAFFIANNTILLRLILGTPLRFVIFFLPLGLNYYLASNFERLSTTACYMFFYAYGLAMGTLLAPIFLLYTSSTIFLAFFSSAFIFFTAALYGRITSKDLSSLSSIVVVCFVGVIFASIVNLFMQSSFIEFTLSIAIICIMSVVIAMENQNLLSIYYRAQNSKEMAEKISIVGALSLYIAFINIFIRMLHLLDSKKR